jgi:hypothetical protein
MKYKTLVKNYNTNYWEFYGYVVTHGWCTSTQPIQIMHEAATWSDVLSAFPDEDFDDVDLVTFEVAIIDVDSKFDLSYCDKCIQMTNHLGGLCKKCAV